MVHANATTTPLARDESCAFLAPDRVTGCRAPRSCHSCLDVAGCMVNASGRCVSQLDEPFDAMRGYERAIAGGFALPNATSPWVSPSPQQWLFPAGHATYCAMSDTVCRVCRRAGFWHTSSEDPRPDSRFCVGEGGACVCIDVCERPSDVQADCSSSSLRKATAPPPSGSYVGTTTNGTNNGDHRDWQALVGATAFAVVALAFLLRARRDDGQRRRGRQHCREARGDRRESQSGIHGVEPLNLSGCETHRRELIAKENTHRTADDTAITSPREPDTNGNTSEQGETGRTAYVRVDDEDSSHWQQRVRLLVVAPQPVQSVRTAT